MNEYILSLKPKQTKRYYIARTHNNSAALHTTKKTIYLYDKANTWVLHFRLKVDISVVSHSLAGSSFHAREPATMKTFSGILRRGTSYASIHIERRFLQRWMVALSIQTSVRLQLIRRLVNAFFFVLNRLVRLPAGNLRIVHATTVELCSVF